MRVPDLRRGIRLGIILVAFVLSAGGFLGMAGAEVQGAAADALVPPQVQAGSAILVDMDNGRVIFSKNADAERAMASITKIMTALLALETLPLDQEVTVSTRAASVGKQWLGLEAGDRLTVEQLLYAVLLRSGNNAALALAEAASGTVEDFVARMNQRAEELGLTRTQYVNPHGLDAAGHHSSAADVAALARVAMQDEVFRRIVATMDYSILVPGAETPLVFNNRNELLGSVSWVTGIKTGETSAAGCCLVGSGTRDGHSVISVVMGEPDWDVTWADSLALMEFGFEWAESLVDEPSGGLLHSRPRMGL